MGIRVYIGGKRSILVPASSRSRPSGWRNTFAVQRAPTDPYYYANLILQNVIGGSRYRITDSASGTELASGLVGGSVATDVTINGLAAYSNPALLRVTIRRGTSAPKYQPFETFTYLYRVGSNAYISQIPDPIA